VVDAHALSFYDHDPDGLSAEDEAQKAYDMIQRWYRSFPMAKVCIGNHDARHMRTANKNGIPSRYIRNYNEIWGTRSWDWALQHRIDRVLYEHGTGSSGKDAAFNRAMAQRCSLVMGHIHSYAGVKYNANPFDRIFGMNVGCGLDIDAYAFNYAKDFVVRPVLGCGIVIDGQIATFVPMRCSKGEPYHRSRFDVKKKVRNH
jgi:hypothetical protein